MTIAFLNVAGFDELLLKREKLRSMSTLPVSTWLLQKKPCPLIPEPSASGLISMSWKDWPRSRASRTKDAAYAKPIPSAILRAVASPDFESSMPTKAWDRFPQ